MGSDESNFEDEFPLWDYDSALKRMRGKVERLEKMINLFVTEMDSYRDSLEKAFKSGDIEQAKIDAHTIKGAAANISALRLQESSALIESAFKEGDLAQVGAQWELFNQSYNDSNAHFKSWLDNR